MSPADMAREVVEKAAREKSAGRATLVTVVRSMVIVVCGVVVVEQKVIAGNDENAALIK